MSFIFYFFERMSFVLNNTNIPPHFSCVASAWVHLSSLWTPLHVVPECGSEHKVSSEAMCSQSTHPNSLRHQADYFASSHWKISSALKWGNPFYFFFFLGPHLQHIEVPRGWIRAAAVSLHNSHSHNLSHTGSKPHLPLTLQLAVTLDA